AQGALAGVARYDRGRGRQIRAPLHARRRSLRSQGALAGAAAPAATHGGGRRGRGGFAAMRIPSATYRLQFTADFGFGAAAEVLPYLKDLGISDIYASPIFQARAG